MTHVLEKILGEKGKENKSKFPSKTFLPNVGGKGKEKRLKWIKKITEIIKITKLPTLSK